MRTGSPSSMTAGSWSSGRTTSSSRATDYMPTSGGSRPPSDRHLRLTSLSRRSRASLHREAGTARSRHPHVPATFGVSGPLVEAGAEGVHEWDRPSRRLAERDADLLDEV